MVGSLRFSSGLRYTRSPETTQRVYRGETYSNVTRYSLHFGDEMEYKDFCWFLAALLWSFTGGLIIGVIRFLQRPIESIWARNGVDSD